MRSYQTKTSLRVHFTTIHFISWIKWVTNMSDRTPEVHSQILNLHILTTLLPYTHVKIVLCTKDTILNNTWNIHNIDLHINFAIVSPFSGIYHDALKIAYSACFFLQTISHNQHGKKPCCVVLANIFAIREYLSSLTILNEIFVPYVVDLRKINIFLSLLFQSIQNKK